MNYGKDDAEMWTQTEADRIQYEANRRGHLFDCECSECARTKKLELLLRRERR